MGQEQAIVREHIERISGVKRTWFEWDWSREASSFAKTLVVEVTFDTDPNSDNFRPFVLDEIRDTAATVLEHKTTMTVSHIRIVPGAR